VHLLLNQQTQPGEKRKAGQSEAGVRMSRLLRTNSFFSVSKKVTTNVTCVKNIAPVLLSFSKMLLFFASMNLRKGGPCS